VKGDTLIFERGEHVYLVAPVAPFDPGENELDELAFAEDLKKMAPNENIGWLRGQYVEAERANENGAMWSSEELAIKSLTPMFMPVTVMHDPRSAVGLIADTKLLTRDQHNVPRARIDTTLGIWRHRFPGVWDEVASNYESGTLMQSMECLPRWYECGDCGRRYPKLPGGAEKANWCAHLRGEENAKATRRLGNVTFTGTGLIFGTRGARGALDSAHLEVFQDEVAEFHERVHSGRRSVRRTSTVDTIEIKRSEYDELKTAAARVPDLEKKVSTLEESAGKVPTSSARSRRRRRPRSPQRRSATSSRRRSRSTRRRHAPASSPRTASASSARTSRPSSAISPSSGSRSRPASSPTRSGPTVSRSSRSSPASSPTRAAPPPTRTRRPSPARRRLGRTSAAATAARARSAPRPASR
jgi:hypothetical protein